jgi:hypothetical protein
MKTNYILYTRQLILSFLILFIWGQTHSWGQTTLVVYSFEDSNLNPDASPSPIGSPSLAASSTVSYFGGSGTSSVASACFSSANTKYFELTIETTGFEDITVNWNARTSSTVSNWVVTGDDGGGYGGTLSTHVLTTSFAAGGPLVLASSFDNKASIKIRWTADVDATQTIRIDDIVISGTYVSSTTDSFRSLATGNWNTAGTWQSSPNGTDWYTSTLVPTSTAASVTIQAGHTVTINADASASNITVKGTGVLTFDGAAARAVTVTGNITIEADGTFITQAAGTYTNTLAVTGDISNAGIFDMSDGTTTRVCNITFNKNGNQTVSGAGATTRFHRITLDMGATKDNILEITASNFSSSTSTDLNNAFTNGTLKISTAYTGIIRGTISTNAGLWLHHASINTTAQAGTITLAGRLEITAGTFNVGTSAGNSITYQNGSEIIITGGTLNIAGRLCSASSSGNQSTTYSQSGGTVVVNTVGNSHAALSSLEFKHTSSSFTMSGGTIIIRNRSTDDGIKDVAFGAITNSISGGTIQFADASTASYGTSNTTAFGISSSITLPSIYVFAKDVGGNYAKLLFSENNTIGGALTAEALTTVDVNTRTITTTGASTIAGTMTISTGTYDANGTFNATGGNVTFSDAGNLNLGGAVTSLGTFTKSTSTVTFDGASAQNVPGVDYHHLVVNGSDSKSIVGNPTISGNLTVTAGTLTFDGAAARAVAVTGNITIGAGGTFITQAAGAFTNTLSVTGDISNAGVLDFSRAGTTLVCDVTFNKNGNQTVSGAGATTRFHKMTLDMGATKDNILEITTDNFAAPNAFLASNLLNGTLKLSGTFTYSGYPFAATGSPTIPATAGLWINNSSVTITAIDGSYDLFGTLRISNGVLNIGTTAGNSIRYEDGSEITISGGTVNIAGRISSNNSTGQYSTTYNQSGGTVVVNTSGNTGSTLSSFEIKHASSSFTMSGGTIIIRNKATNTSLVDVFLTPGTSSVTGGTIQFADASTSLDYTSAFKISTTITLPSIFVHAQVVNAAYATLLFSSGATISGTFEAEALTTVDVNTQTVAVTGASTMSGTLTISTGTYDANGTFTAAGGAVTFTDAGNLYLANTVTSLGTFTEDVSTVTYDQTGDQNVLGETYHHLVINGSGTKTLGGSIDVNGDLTISAGTLAAASPYDITLAGDWTNNGTFTHANRKVTFDGAATQEITDGNPTTFYDLEINNGTNVIISEDATVTNVVTFTAGDFVTSRSVSPTYLILGTDASVSGVSAASHVNGPMQKLTNTTGSFTFPVGDGTSYRSMAIVPSSTDATTWTAKYTKASYGTLAVEGSLDHVSSLEYWNLDRPSGSADATITLSWDANSAVDANFTELVVAHYKTGTSTWENASAIDGGHHTGDATAGTVRSDANWSTFSPFTLASTTANNPLPVTLTYLNAACQEEKVNITWQTASELNADYFAVERSTDGYDWSVLGTVRAGGNSTSTLNYQWLDRNPTRSITSYYRLRQVDFDGVQELYGPISVTCEGNPAVFELEIFPNPAETSATVLVSWNGATEEATLLITDMTGKTASSNTIQLKNGTNLHQIDLTNLSKGIYNFSLIVKGEIQNSEKIIKQ